MKENEVSVKILSYQKQNLENILDSNAYINAVKLLFAERKLTVKKKIKKYR